MTEYERYQLDGDTMNEDLIQTLVKATRIACTTITSPRQAALQARLDQARAVPAGLGWERKAAEHAEFFTALADAADDPLLTPTLSHGTRFAYDLMISAGPAADSIVTNSRKRMLAHLRTGDADEAALEMEEHLRILHFMNRLAAPLPRRQARSSSVSG